MVYFGGFGLLLLMLLLNRALLGVQPNLCSFLIRSAAVTLLAVHAFNSDPKKWKNVSISYSWR
jgi:hypothetical protein